MRGANARRALAGLAGAAIGFPLAGCSPAELDVVDVAGEPVPEAVARLDDAGFIPEFSGFDANDESAHLWLVRTQQPRYGTLPRGAAIRLTAVSVLEAASGECEAGRAGDAGRSLVLDMKGEDPGTGTLTISDIVCVLGALDAPDAVRTKMSQTTSLDGRVTDTWAGIEASWKYHPDEGLDVILVIP